MAKISISWVNPAGEKQQPCRHPHDGLNQSDQNPLFNTVVD